LRKTEYLGIVCESLLLKKSVSPYYVLNITDRQLPFTGVIEMSNLAGSAEFGGYHLVYLPRYSDQEEAIWDFSDLDIHQKNLQGLKKIAPLLSSEDIIDWRIHRSRYVQPVQSVGRGCELPPTQLADGLAYVSSAQIHPWPVFNDEAIRNVDLRLPQVLETLKVLS
jgi:protoporphyrinogen oxidase